MSTYFYVYPFGVSGTRLVIPTADPGGTPDPVSYQNGFGADYSKVLGTDPDALPIPRPEFNDLMYQVTNNIQEYQTRGVPLFITSADNLGVPYPYPIYARVIYDAGSGDQVWENQEAANIVAPGVDDSWLLISGSSGVPTGTIIDFAGFTAPTGYFLCGGQQVSRVTYERLMNAITQIQTGTTTIASTHITGLTDARTYLFPGIGVEGTGIPAGAYIDTIVSDNEITISIAATASGSVPVTFFNWGNGDGSTTFNVPDFRRSVAMGAGGSFPTYPIPSDQIGIVTGQEGGLEGQAITISQMPSHNHPPLAPAINFVGSRAGGADRSPTGITGGDDVLTTGLTGGSDPYFKIQPSIIVTKCIKY
jgi:microcystin-dependent protein